ncbi:MAG: hypothetical protein ACK55S_10145 [Planctomycetota bacterium]
MFRSIALGLAVSSLLVSFCMAQSQDSTSAATNELIAELKFFEPFLGKTFRGEFANSTSEKPMHDVSRLERAMNGRAIRILHSVNEGEYGGETIVMWDAETKQIRSWYFTTAGFHTEGSLTIEDNRLVSSEKVTGNENGITEVKATSELKSDGQLAVKSEYFAKGSWVPGHTINYKETPDAKVIFK